MKGSRNMEEFSIFNTGGFKLPGNDVRLTQTQWKEFLKFKDEYLKNQRIANWQRQKIQDTLGGGICSINMNEYGNTYVFNNFGILDADHDLIIDFELIDEMTILVQCKVGFKARNFRSGVII